MEHYLRNLSPLSPGQYYCCWDCGDGDDCVLVDKDCGHYCFGVKENLRHPIPNRIYYCNYCGHCLVEEDGHGCYGDKNYLINLITLGPGCSQV